AIETAADAIVAAPTGPDAGSRATSASVGCFAGFRCLSRSPARGAAAVARTIASNANKRRRETRVLISVIPPNMRRKGVRPLFRRGFPPAVQAIRHRRTVAARSLNAARKDAWTQRLAPRGSFRQQLVDRKPPRPCERSHFHRCGNGRAVCG